MTRQPMGSTKYIFLFLFCMGSFAMSAQVIHADSLVGEWICTAINPYPNSELKASEKPIMDTFSKIFVDVQFTFKSDGTFSCAFPKAPAQVASDLESVNGKKWTYQPERKRIVIGELQENLMHIYVSKRNGAMIFEMADIPLFLTMTKK